MNAPRSIGLVEPQYATLAQPPDTLELDGGARLGPITLAYETYGALNDAKSNAILILHALSGDAHVAGKHAPEDPKPGWWDTMVGPGKPFDTDRYFIICSNVLGGCRGSTGPSSPNPATGQPYGLDFPVVTIADMVRAQRLLIAHLGIERLFAVAGGSMGGMQALEWATRYPDIAGAAIIIASTHISGAQAIAFDAVGRNAIQGDPDFQGGHYYGRALPAQGLAVARMLAHITYLSDDAMHAKFGRSLRNAATLSYEFGSEFNVETYLDHQGAQFVDRFDANSYLYITKAIDYFDLAAGHGSLEAALEPVQHPVLVVSFSSDWLYPPRYSEQIVHALARQGKSVSYSCIESGYGHDAFLLETGPLGGLITAFLDRLEPHTDCCWQPACGACCPLQRGAPGRHPGCPAQHAAAARHAPVARQSIYEGRRVDYDLIVDLIGEGARVLDIGCGDGVLLCRLQAQKNVAALGFDLDYSHIRRCIQRGVDAIQGDVDKGLGALRSQSFDYVVLSMTLQVVQHPDLVLDEMLRVGRRCLVSFPNFGHWRARAGMLLEGRAPVTPNLPYAWHNTPNLRVLSLKDFRAFCKDRSARIEQEIPLDRRGRIRLAPNLRAEEALYIVSKPTR